MRRRNARRRFFTIYRLATRAVLSFWSSPTGAALIAQAVARGLVPWLDPHPTIPIESARTATNRGTKRQTRNMVPTHALGATKSPRYGDANLLRLTTFSGDPGL